MKKYTVIILCLAATSLGMRRLPPQVSDASEVLHLKLWDGPVSSGKVFDYTFNGYNGTLSGGTGTPVSSPPGFKFSATNTQYIDIGAGPTSVKTVSLWIKLDDVDGDEFPIDLNGTDRLIIDSGVINVVNFTAPQLYVNGVLGTDEVTAIAAGTWNHIVITDTTAANANNLDIGKSTVGPPGLHFDGSISDVRLYSTVRTAAQVRDFYNQTRWRYQK